MRIRLGHVMDYALFIAVVLASVISAHAQVPAQQSRASGRPTRRSATGPARRAAPRAWRPYWTGAGPARHCNAIA